MNTVSRLSKVGAAVALVFAVVAPQVAKADGVAQSILSLSAFKFQVGNNAAGGGTPIGAGITVGTPVVTGDTFAALVGFGAAFGVGPSCVGACGSYAAFTPLVGAPVATFTGSTNQFSGSALSAAGATARTDNTVSLKPSGDGTAAGNVNLGVDFTVTVGGTAVGSTLQISFDATSFLRGFLDVPGINATASSNWVISISRAGLGIFSWSPNGVVTTFGATGGTEYLDAFNINDTVSQLNAGNEVRSNGVGSFEAETAGLAAGEYTVSLRHSGAADAETNRRDVPEPGSLSLISLALIGAGFALRRRRGNA